MKKLKGFRLDVELIEALEAQAKFERRKVGEVMSEALRQYIGAIPVKNSIPIEEWRQVNEASQETEPDGPFEPDVMPPMPDEVPPWEEEKPTIKRIGGSDSAKKFYTTR